MRTVRAPAATLLLCLALVVGLQVAHALSEWWTPPNASCPTFDSEESCEDFCRQNTARCGGALQCVWKTGEKRPQC